MWSYLNSKPTSMQTRAERMMSKIAGDGRLQHRSFLTRRDRGPGQEVLRLYDGVENSKPIELRVMMTDGTFRDAATLYEFIQQFWVEQAARFDLFPDADLFCTSVMLPLHNSQLSGYHHSTRYRLSARGGTRVWQSRPGSRPRSSHIS
jgi:hypothetical protein